MKVRVVLNEQQQLLSQQEEVLKKHFGEDLELEQVRIPAQDLSCDQQADFASRIVQQCAEGEAVVAASPFPVLLAKLAMLRTMKSFVFGVFVNSKKLWLV